MDSIRICPGPSICGPRNSSRRVVLGNSIFGAVGLFFQNAQARGAIAAQPFVPYTDDKNGFTILTPENWSKVDKKGATVFFEDPAKKSNNLGIIVSRARVSSLSAIGGAQDFADRVLQAERKKDGTVSADLLDVKSKEIQGAIPLYEIEYRVDSVRGLKRVYSGITIASKKVYILNLAVAEDESDPKLKAIVDSFDIVRP